MGNTTVSTHCIKCDVFFLEWITLPHIAYVGVNCNFLSCKLLLQSFINHLWHTSPFTRRITCFWIFHTATQIYCTLQLCAITEWTTVRWDYIIHNISKRKILRYRRQTGQFIYSTVNEIHQYSSDFNQDRALFTFQLFIAVSSESGLKSSLSFSINFNWINSFTPHCNSKYGLFMNGQTLTDLTHTHNSFQ